MVLPCVFYALPLTFLRLYRTSALIIAYYTCDQKNLQPMRETGISNCDLQVHVVRAYIISDTRRPISPLGHTRTAHRQRIMRPRRGDRITDLRPHSVDFLWYGASVTRTDVSCRGSPTKQDAGVGDLPASGLDWIFFTPQKRESALALARSCTTIQEQAQFHEIHSMSFRVWHLTRPVLARVPSSISKSSSTDLGRTKRVPAGVSPSLVIMLTIRSS